MSFQQGLSGLNAAAKNLDVIGNNVANSNTTGFKGSVSNFADVFAASLGGGGAATIGIGTTLSAVAQQFSQGNITSTNNPLDIAVNGKGFFRMSQSGTISFSRNGQFSVDKSGYIVDSGGQNLTGYNAENGTIIPGVLTNLQMSNADLAPEATSKITVGANLTAGGDILTATPFDKSDPKTFNYSTATALIDSLGEAHTATLYFNKTADKAVATPWGNSWKVRLYIDDTPADVAGAETMLYFDTSGNLLTNPAAFGLASATTNLNKTVVLTNGAADLSLTLDYTQMTQFGSAYGVNTLDQDGFATGQLNGYSIGADGTILGRYSNGKAQTLGQVALANFNNPQGLKPMGESQWAESAESGAALVGAPGSAALGVLQSAAREDSNVDLTAELVNMITAQRVYQANAQSIKTQDAVMQTLVNMR